jgi:hypothetical protein
MRDAGGIEAGFNPEAFRSGILSAMNMATPEDSDQRVTFRWKDQKDYDVKDRTGKPFVWTQEPESTVTKDDVQVPCAVQFVSRTTLAGQNAIADMDTSRAELTLLDAQYQLVKDADIVLIGTNEYRPDFVAPPSGLFGETIWTMFVSAIDESGEIG